MDVVTFSSSLSIHFLPLSEKHQRVRHPPTQFAVWCRATKQLLQGVDDNLYKVLSLSPNSATMDDIKKAYRSMALRYHPDVCHDGSKKEETTRMFVQLNAAYRTLSNPWLRADYDYELGLRSEKSVVGNESGRSKWLSWREGRTYVWHKRRVRGAVELERKTWTEIKDHHYFSFRIGSLPVI